MMKRTVGARGVFLGALGRCLSELATIGPLGVAVNLCGFLDLELLGEGEEGWGRMETLSWLTKTATEVACLVRLAAQSLSRYLAAPIETSFVS